MQDLMALGWVFLIDLVLAGDNALIIAALVAPLAPAARRVALLFGIGVAIIARAGLSLCALWLLTLPYLGILGGGFLIWLAIKLAREAQAGGFAETTAQLSGKRWHAVIGAIAAADLSMSIDNILAVGAAAQGHPFALVAGLLMSMCLMGAAAHYCHARAGRHGGRDDWRRRPDGLARRDHAPARR